jgi:DNA-directed RNA polymerase subunit M/transcription elongation factor TFIIS
MEFCVMCGNMLYLRMEENNMIYYCKNCNFTKVPEDPNASICISTNYQDESVKYSMFINPNIKYDPTLPHVNNIPCTNPKCNKPEHESNNVIYMKYDPVNMKYIYFCTHCEHFWKLSNV